jgi:hypothetical protein
VRIQNLKIKNKPLEKKHLHTRTESAIVTLVGHIRSLIGLRRASGSYAVSAGKIYHFCFGFASTLIPYAAHSAIPRRPVPADPPPASL